MTSEGSRKSGLFFGLGEQLKGGGYEFAVFYLACNFRFSDRVAESCRGMGIAVRIDVSSIHKIGFAINPYREVAAFFIFHFKLALSAGCFHNLHLARGLLCVDADGEYKQEEYDKLFHDQLFIGKASGFKPCGM